MVLLLIFVDSKKCIKLIFFTSWLLQERDPPEGPIPHLEARLSVLLCIVPLAIANVLNDEVEHDSSSVQVSIEPQFRSEIERKSVDSKKHGLILSVQILGHFSSFLCPPESVVGAANIAAIRAAYFIHNSKNEEDGSGTGIHYFNYTKAGHF